MRRINGFILLMILLMTLFVMLGMACNKSPSAPVGLYRLIISPPAKGEYVALAMPLKMIAWMPGDWISTTPIGTYINGRLVPNSAPLLSQHYPYGTFELGASSLWLIGKDPICECGRNSHVPTYPHAARVENMTVQFMLAS